MPVNNPTIYFGLGEAVGALGFTIAFQQLLKPIYVFRLNARYFSVRTLYAIVFAGAAAVMIAVTSVVFELWRSVPLLDPFLIQIVGAMLFIVAYGAVATALVFPVTVRPYFVTKFAQSSARLLSSASEQ